MKRYGKIVLLMMGIENALEVFVVGKDRSSRNLAMLSMAFLLLRLEFFSDARPYRSSVVVRRDQRIRVDIPTGALKNAWKGVSHDIRCVPNANALFPFWIETEKGRPAEHWSVPDFGPRREVYKLSPGLFFPQDFIV